MQFTKGKSVNKSEFIKTLADRFDGNQKAAQHALEAVLDTISRELVKGEKVAITGFGAFEKVVRPSRMVRNPRTGERKRAKKTAVPKFKAGADLKKIVSGEKKLAKAAVSSVRRTATAATKTATGARKSTATKTAAKKTTARTTTAKKTTAKTSPAKKTTTRTTTAKKTTARTTPAKKTTAKTSPAKKTTAKTTPAKTTTSRTTTAKKAPASKSTAKKAPAKRAAKKS